MESTLSSSNLFDELAQELYDVVITEDDCFCHGHLRQIDGYISPGVRVRILEEPSGYRVNIGKITNNPGRVVSGVELLRILDIAE